MLMSMQQYWADHPPLYILVAAYLGVKPKHSTKNIEEASEFVPVETCTKEDFNNLLQKFGLPVSD